MESLYVCLFSNGHIKVGRSNDPLTRIKQHADRVSCLGVSLEDHRMHFCSDSQERELMLVSRCADACEFRFGQEWFSGLNYQQVCDWMTEIAQLEKIADNEEPEEPESPWCEVIAMLKTQGWTQMRLAAECGCKQPSISDIASGRTMDPSYSVGSVLLRLANLRDLPARRVKAA